MIFVKAYLEEAKQVIDRLDPEDIGSLVKGLIRIRNEKGRLFILGVGGSAANASHAVNDFRKITGIETYAPTDNVSELTARTNDEGWSSIFAEWLKTSNLNNKDALLILSVGGGDLENNVSTNLIEAVKLAKDKGSRILGIISRDGGYVKRVAETCVLIPVINPIHTTPHAEAFQAVIWHLLVSHPDLKIKETKWESIK